MRISDWSSDVCSSDLPASRRGRPLGQLLGLAGGRRRRGGSRGPAHRRVPATQPRPDGLGTARAVRRDPGAAVQRRRLSTPRPPRRRSEEHTSELQSLMRISYAVFCLKKKKNSKKKKHYT